MASNAHRPDVTVVVISYNDAARVETAVQSVLDQSLRSREVIVVDDHSSDNTAEVMQRVVARHPDDCRYLRLPANSGHCGAPRNAGVKLARGRYVMFLDSDDVLDQHALRNLVSMAEESDADMVVGRCVRRDVATGKEQAWMPWLVKDKVVYESLRDQPDLLYDVLSTNKLYRHDFLIRENLVFLENRYYEDNLFSAHAYLAAKRIAVIPQRVYIWNVERSGSSLSISNRPREVRNLTDRIAVTEQIDALLAAHGTPELRLQKDIRFIDNDLRTHLGGIRDLPHEGRQQLIDVARPYVLGIDPEAFRQAKPLAAIAAYMVREGDADGAVDAYNYMVYRPRHAHLTSPLTVRDGRVYWSEQYLDDPLGKQVLDVTELGFQDLPLAKLQLGSEVTGARHDGESVTLTGTITNPLGRLSGRKVTADLVMRARRHRGLFTTRTTVENAGDVLLWTATITAADAPRPIGVLDPIYAVTLRAKAGDETFNLQLFATDAVIDELHLPVRPKLTELAGDRMDAYRTDNGNLALRLTAAGPRAQTGAKVIRGLRSHSVGGRVWGKAASVQRDARNRLNERATKLAWYDNVFSRVPISEQTIVFESHMGKQFSDSPRAIYEELKRSGVQFRAVWSYAGDHPNGFPSDVKLVRRMSYAYLRELGRARYWVDNQGFPHDLRKRAGTTYIQTWHGSAFKRMGFDEAKVKSQTAGQQQRLQDAIDRFDVFLVRTEHDVRTLTKGMRVNAELMRVGYPRNDVLVKHDNTAEVAALRKSLNLTDDRKVLLYAPTFRPQEISWGNKGLQLPFSLDHFVERFGDEYVLLVRPHYLVNFALPPGYDHSVRNVRNVHDVTPLMQLADGVITDYSSLMFDYAVLDRPMIFHVPDYDDYVGSTRGSYFDLAEVAPGPLTRTEDEFFAALADLGQLRERYAEQHSAFLARFCEYDTGTAAKAVVDRFFPGGRRG